jgi:hypothetical protein
MNLKDCGMKQSRADLRNQLATAWTKSGKLKETHSRYPASSLKFEPGKYEGRMQHTYCEVWCYAGDNTSTRIHGLQMNANDHSNSSTNFE